MKCTVVAKFMRIGSKRTDQTERPAGCMEDGATGRLQWEWQHGSTVALKSEVSFQAVFFHLMNIWNIFFQLRLRFPPLKNFHPFEHSGRNGVSSIDAPAKGGEVSSLSKSLSDTWHWHRCCFGQGLRLKLMVMVRSTYPFSPVGPWRLYEIFKLIAQGISSKTADEQA